MTTEEAESNGLRLTAKQPNIGGRVDAATDAIGRQKPNLRYVLAKNFSGQNKEQVRIKPRTAIERFLLERDYSPDKKRSATGPILRQPQVTAEVS